MGPNEQLLLIGFIYFLVAGLAYLIILQKSKNQVSETKFVTEQLLIYVVISVCFYFHNYLLSLFVGGFCLAASGNWVVCLMARNQAGCKPPLV